MWELGAGRGLVNGEFGGERVEAKVICDADTLALTIEGTRPVASCESGAGRGADARGLALAYAVVATASRRVSGWRSRLPN
jgi:hypothetical protein